MPPETAGPHRILVVDDEPDITALVAYHLAKEGYRVTTAAVTSNPMLAKSRVASLMCDGAAERA